MLRLVNQTPQTDYDPQVKASKGKIIPLSVNNSPTHEPVLTDVREIAHDLYAAKFNDIFHGLYCEIILEKRSIYTCDDESYEEGDSLEAVIACEFPKIDIQRLSSLMRCDEYLQAMLIIQFQLKILEQMLLFCEVEGAAYISLTFNDCNLDYLEIYQNFIISQKEIITAQGKQNEIVISSDVSTYDDLLDFMDKVKHEFLQTLWRDQKVNGAYRAYLKSQAMVELY